MTVVTGPHCDGCPNQSDGEKLVMPDGHGTNHIMLVGDSPWKMEIAAGRNFSGPSGWYLERTLQRLRLQRQEFTVANCMWCKPPHLGWTDHPERFPDASRSIEHCAPYLDGLIRERKPRCFVALGNVALRRLTGFTNIEHNHSYVFSTRYGIPAVPSFHPSHIMQGQQKLTSVLMFSIRRAQEVADGTYQSTKLDLLLDPTVDKARQYLEAGDGSGELMVDIETPESGKLSEEEAEDDASYHIIRVGFSNRLGTSVSFPWEGPYRQLALEAISRAKLVLFWNKNYDYPRLYADGCRFGQGAVIHDAMWAWHFLQSDLLKALAFVAPFFYSGPPWKHLNNEQPAFYNAMDAAVQMLCYRRIREELKKQNRWDRFLRHCVEVEPILISGGSRGVKIDIERRELFFGTLRDELKATRAKLNTEVPTKLRKVKSWVRQPKDMTDVEIVEVPAFHKDGSPVMTAGGQQLTKPAWQKIMPFNENSPEQLKDLIRHLGLKVPVVRGEDRETTEAKHLLRFSKKHSIFKTILFAKQRGKLLSTYQWPLDQHGRVYTTFGFHPSTWRKSSRKVNLQNIPKRNDLAQKFRQMIVAEPGHKFVTADASAIEAVLVGFDAGSESYIRIAKAGIHGWMTSAFHKEVIPLDLPFAELAARCKAAKKKWPADYEVLKRVDHLSNYLGTPARIYEEYPEEFESEGQAKVLQNFYFSTDPGKTVRAWQHRKLERAHRETYLDNHFQYRHYFYEVFKWDSRKKQYVFGDDAKRAVAFVPQADASAVQTEVLLRLAQHHGFLDWFRLIVHDEIACEVPDDKVAECCQLLGYHMTLPLPELDGLSIGAEVKVGSNLGNWNASTNPEGIKEWTPQAVAA